MSGESDTMLGLVENDLTANPFEIVHDDKQFFEQNLIQRIEPIQD
jgi:hypothetical protein